MSRFAPFLVAVALLLFAGPASRGAEMPLNERRSAYEDMSRDNKAMQDDDTSNPGMLAVLDGEALWAAKTGASGKSCRLKYRKRSPRMVWISRTLCAFRVAMMSVVMDGTI